MRVIFMGTPDFAVGTLNALVEADHEVLAVVTQPDKPRGRGKNLCCTPVKEEALRHGLAVCQPKKVRDPEFIETLRQLKPEAIVVVAFGQIIPKEILEMAPYGCLNVHASLLPKYRGAAPIPWAVIDGEKESGVTIMRMDEGLDTGDMISRSVVSLDPKETGGSLFDKLSQVGAKLLVETLEQVKNGQAVYERQPEQSPTAYASMIDKKMGNIDWTMPAVKIERLIRGLSPWPSAYTFLEGKTLKIWAARVVQEETTARPGEIFHTDKRGIYVAAGEGVLCLDEVQLEGKRRMAAADFLRGCKIEKGTRLTMNKE